MPEYLTRDIKIGLSNIIEANYNALVPGVVPGPPIVNNYFGMLTTGRGFPLPDKEKQDDTGKVGYGREFPREQRSGYITPPTMEITDELNTNIAPILLRRAMGGADPVPAGPAILEPLLAFEHSWLMQDNASAAGRQLPSSSVVYALGGADYLFGGCVVESFRVEQAAAGVPTFTAGLTGSGLFRRIRDLVGDAAPNVPAPTKMNYLLGAETLLKWTDASGTYIITDVQRLKAFTLTLANNHRPDDRRPGDPRIDPLSTKKGWYVNRMLHGDRAVTGEMTVMLNDDLRELSNANDDIEITNFTYRSRGHYITNQAGTTTSTVNQHTFELVLPKCYFRAVRGDDDGGDAIVRLGIFAVEDGTNFGLLRARIVNGQAAAII